MVYYSTVKSFVELVQFILKVPGAQFFLSERISQDPLENFLECKGKEEEQPQCFSILQEYSGTSGYKFSLWKCFQRKLSWPETEY